MPAGISAAHPLHRASLARDLAGERSVTIGSRKPWLMIHGGVKREERRKVQGAFL